MRLAALADDREAFQRYYRKALDAARTHMDKTGPQEAEDYIARNWTSRHPLKSPFKTPTTPEELQRLLAAVGERGARDVQTFIDNYNRYAEFIGSRPYVGKQPRGTRNRRTLTLAELTGLPQKLAIFDNGNLPETAEKARKLLEIAPHKRPAKLSV